MENNNKMWEMKDKRISFLSIFSSLMESFNETMTGEYIDERINTIKDRAFEINDELYKKYSIPEQGGSSYKNSTQKRTTSSNNSSDNVKKERLCPVCQSPMIRQTEKKNELAPDWKCSNRNCKFTFKGGKWVASKYITGVWDINEDKLRNEDNILDEATHYGHDNPPPEYC